MVDSDGNTVGPEELGLLLWNGGTVCDEGFDDNSADAICRVLGHTRHTNWTSGEILSIQNDYQIHMGNVNCSSGYWSSCTFEKSPDCGHDKDVYLLCSEIIPGEVNLCLDQKIRSSTYIN